MALDQSRIAVVWAALSEDARAAIKLSRLAGFSGLQFDAYCAGLNIPDLDNSGRREFRHLLSTQDQRLVGLAFDAGPKGFGPGADVDQILARLDRVMEAAAGLQAPLVSLDLGPLPEPPRPKVARSQVTPQQAGLIIIPTLAAAPAPESTTLPSIPPTVDPTFVAQLDSALATLGQRADRYSVTVAMRTDLASFAALERAIKTVNCPWFGVDLDPVAMLRDEWPIDEIFSRLGNLIRHVRARDALRGADRRTQPSRVGQGHTNWGELLADLDAASYHGWITVDSVELPDRSAATTAALKHLLAIG